jgi:hypothetical protein
MNKKTEKAREYPYSAWVLSSAYIPKPATFVAKAWGIWADQYDKTAEGKSYKQEAIHKTKQAAIEWGRQQIAAREEYLKKQHALLDARRIKLDKAEGK